MLGKLTEREKLGFEIEEARRAAEQHRVVEETTIRELMNLRDQEPRRLDREIAERRERAKRRLAADEHKIGELIRLQQIAACNKATVLERWAESLEIDAAVKNLPIHPGDELDLPAAVRQKWIEAIPFPVVDTALVARLTLEIARLRAVRRASFGSAAVALCSHPDCSYQAQHECAFCSERYCDDFAHGWPEMPVIEGKRETASICWRCQAKLRANAA